MILFCENMIDSYKEGLQLLDDKFPFSDSLPNETFVPYVKLFLFPIAISPYFLNFSGLIYLIFAIALSSYYIFISYLLLKEKNPVIEKK